MNCSLPEISRETINTINNLGEKFAVKYFRDNGLSNFSSFDELLNKNSIIYSEAKLQEVVEKFLPKNKFQVKHLDNIISILPASTQAAFFKDVLYFGNNVTKEQIAEETFHAIFQRVIPTSLKENYLQEGRGLIDNLENQKKQYLSSYPKAQLFSNKELEERVIEEAIAKKYVEYFNNNISPSNKKGILKLLDNLFKWLKSLFNNLRKDADLEVLFDNIIKGKFTKSSVVDENFSEVPTLRLVEYQTKDESGRNINRNLTVKESEFLISALGSVVIGLNNISREKLENLGLTNRPKRIKFAIEKLREVYERRGDNPKFVSALSQHQKEEFNEDAEDYDNMYTTINLPNLKDLAEDVNTYLNIVTGVELKNAEIDEDEVAELNFGDNIAANERGFEGMSAWLRSYIATTGSYVDSFDVDGETVNVLRPIDKNKVYYSLARSMQNTTHELERLYKLVTIASFSTNKESRLLLDRVIGDVMDYPISNVDDRFVKFKDDVTALYEEKWKINKKKHHYIINDLKGMKKDRSYILQTILQGFDLWKRDNYKVELKINKSNITTKVYEANQNSASKMQLELWKNHWEERLLNPQEKAKIRKILLDEYKPYIDSKNFTEDVVKGVLNTIFYNVDDSYVKYLLDSNVNNSLGGTFNNSATLEDVEKIFDLALAETGISATKSELFVSGSGGAKSRIEKLADNVSKINENVIESTYKDAENKTRYSYQNKTFQLYMFNEIFNINNIEDYLKDIKKGEIYEYADKKYLKQASSFLYKGENNPYNHIIFNDKEWKSAFLSGDFYSVDGLDSGTGSSTFGGMTNRDFLLWKLHVKAFKTKEGTQPIHINLMEAKRTASFKEVKLVEGLYEKDKITDKALELFKNEIDKEVYRMYEEKSKILNWLNILTKDKEDGEYKIELKRENIIKLGDIENSDGIIEKYHTGTYNVKKEKGIVSIVSGGGRALQFTDNVKSLLKPETFSSIISYVLSTKNIKDNTALNGIKEELNSQLEEYIKEFKLLIKSLKGVLPKSERYRDVNDFINFNRNAFLNDELSSWLNTTWVNQLINSDSALLVKNDGADFVKRAGGQNAAIASLSTTFYSDKIEGIKEFDKIKYVVGNDPQGIVGFKTDEKVDSADAQSYMTVEAYLKYLYSTTKLSKESSEILFKIKEGIELTIEDKEYLKENDVFFNVVKPVGYDGYFYFKTGTVMLTKTLTSVFVNGKWIAKPGREALHNLREKMETTGVDYYLGQTASKQLTINKYTEDFDNIKFEENQIDSVWNSSVNIMSTKFFGQQMENPAGKEKIIDPSQMLEIILNEQLEGGRDFNVMLNGQSFPISKILKKWQQLSVNRIDLSFNEAMNEIADDNLIIQSNKFIDKVRDTLQSSGADDQLLEIFSLDRDGKPLYNLNMSLSVDKFINLLMSHFTKGVLQQKVAGDAMALVSPHGMNVVKKIIKYKTKEGKDVYSWEVVKESSPEYSIAIQSKLGRLENVNEYDEFDNKSQLKGGTSGLINELKKLYKEGKDIYFVDQLRFGKPVYSFDKEGNVNGIEYYGAEALIPKHKEEINIDELKAMFALRIPSQDKQSGVNLIWVDEIASYYGNTIFSPKEIQYLSGSDYDIDKLYIHRKETFEKDGEEIVWNEEHNTFEMYKYFHTTKNTVVKKRINQLLKEHPDYTLLSIKVKKIREEYKEQFDNFEGFINEQNDKITGISNLIAITKSSKKDKQQEIYKEIDKQTKKELFNEIDRELSKIKEELIEKKEVENLINSSKNKIISINDLLKNELTTTEQVEKELESLKKTLLKNKLSTIYKEGGLGEFEDKYINLVQSVKEEREKLTNFFEVIKVLKQRKEIKEKVEIVALKENKLITSKEEFAEQSKDGKILILPIINNQILDLKMRLLMNEKTLDRSEGEAISLTPATQDNLKKLIAKTYIEKDGKTYYLFKKDGKEEFTTEIKYATHSTLGQHIAHKNVVTGKRNIGVAVVANLLHLFSKKANIELKSRIDIIDVKPIDSDGKHQLVDNTLSTFKISRNVKNQRIADIISELISAATDEVKDQQNAKYGLTMEALNIVTPILMLGGSLDFAIRLINTNSVREYLEKISNKDNIVKTETEQDELVGNNELILSKMLGTATPSLQPISIVDLKEGTRDNDALFLASKMLAISKEIGMAKYVINLKKGLGKTLEEFEAGEEKIGSTTKEKVASVQHTNMATVFNQTNSDLEIYQYQIEAHNRLSKLFDKNIVSRKEEFQKFKYFFLNNFKPATYDEAKRWVNDNMISFIYSRLYFNYLEKEGDVNDNNFRKYTESNLDITEKKWTDFVNSVRARTANLTDELMEDIAQNPLLVKLKTNPQGRIYAPTFVKSDLATSTSLLESFLDLHTKLASTPYSKLLWELFHYSIHKDGWTFKGGSLSKVIPPTMYKKHSKSLDEFLQNPYLYTANYPSGFLVYSAIERSVKTNKGKDFIKSAGGKQAELWKKIFINGKISLSNIEKLSDEDIKWMIDRGYLIADFENNLYPQFPLYHKFQLSSNVVMGMESVIHKIETMKVMFDDGQVRDVTPDQYYYYLDKTTQVLEIEYKPFNFVKKQDDEYSVPVPISNKIEVKEINFGEKVEKEISSPNLKKQKVIVDQIYSQLGNKTQSENVILPKDVDVEADGVGMKYTSAIDFWRKIVPEAMTLYNKKTPLVVAFRGNSQKTFLQNYNSGSHTIGNPFDFRNEIGDRKEQGVVATKKFIEWMITGNNQNNENATEEYRQAIITDIKSEKLKGSSILYYEEKDYATHATALDYLINKYNWSTNQPVVEQKQDVKIVTQPEEVLTDTLPFDNENPFLNNKKDEILDYSSTFKNIIYNEEQKAAIEKAVQFIKTGNPNEWFLVEGKAGVGKTTVAKEIVKEFKGKQIYVAAVSNKAKGVIKNSFSGFPIPISFHSIASLLGQKQDLETGVFKRDEFNFNSIPIEEADIVLIDEGSMINEETLEMIFENKPKNTKVIFLADVGQISPIRTIESKFYQNKKNQNYFGKKSPIFNTSNKVKLLTRVRQGEENPILPYADYFWENSQKENPEENPVKEKRKNITTNKGSLLFTKTFKDVEEFVIKEFKGAIKNENPNHIKLVSYRNATRESINTFIHNSIFGRDSEQFEKGELIIFNSSFDFIENSTEAQVLEVSKENIDNNGFKYVNISIIYENYPLLIPVLLRESKDAFNKMIDDKFTLAKKSGDKKLFREAYELKDSYADVDYGYAITSHKSQGSTYDIVIVDEKDINSVSKIDLKQKSESIYTALTRARNTSIVITSEKFDENNIDVNLLNENKGSSFEIDKNDNLSKNNNTKKEIFIDESKIPINEKRDRVLTVIKKLFKKHRIKYNWSNFQHQFYTPLEIINKIFSNINNFYFTDEELEKAIPAYFGLNGEGLSINISKEKGKEVYVGGLYLPDFMQKKGIGKDIVSIFKHVSFSFYDVNRIYLWSEKDSVSFWEKQGFTKTGEQIKESDKHFFNPDLPPFEVMEYIYDRNKNEDLPSNPPLCI